MKLAKFFNHNFENGDFKLYNKNSYELYHEDSTGFWYKSEFDQQNNVIYYENYFGYWSKREYDQNNNEIYYEDSNGYWAKYEFDQNNNEIYYENSDGDIDDNRPKTPCENKIVEIEGVKYKLIKE